MAFVAVVPSMIMASVYFVKRFLFSLWSVILLSNTNDSHDKTVFLKTRVPENLLQDFRLALAINNETTQDVIQRLISDYIKHTKITPEQLAKFTEH